MKRSLPPIIQTTVAPFGRGATSLPSLLAHLQSLYPSSQIRPLTVIPPNVTQETFLPQLRRTMAVLALRHWPADIVLYVTRSRVLNIGLVIAIITPRRDVSGDASVKLMQQRARLSAFQQRPGQGSRLNICSRRNAVSGPSGRPTLAEKRVAATRNNSGTQAHHCIHCQRLLQARTSSNQPSKEKVEVMRSMVMSPRQFSYIRAVLLRIVWNYLRLLQSAVGQGERLDPRRHHASN